MDFNAAIFDLDGTILDSMDVWEHIDIQFLKKRNLPVPENYVTATFPIGQVSFFIRSTCSL